MKFDQNSQFSEFAVCFLHKTFVFLTFPSDLGPLWVAMVWQPCGVHFAKPGINSKVIAVASSQAKGLRGAEWIVNPWLANM